MLGPSFSLDALCTECRDAVTSCKIVLYKEILRILRTHGTMNFKHLHYFWRVAKAGGVARASSCTCAQTISGPLGLLEDDLGAPLFAKSGRSLELTDAGRLAFGYAQDIRTGRSVLAGSAARIGQRPATDETPLKMRAARACLPGPRRPFLLLRPFPRSVIAQRVNSSLHDRRPAGLKGGAAWRMLQADRADPAGRIRHRDDAAQVEVTRQLGTQCLSRAYRSWSRVVARVSCAAGRLLDPRRMPSTGGVTSVVSMTISTIAENRSPLRTPINLR